MEGSRLNWIANFIWSLADDVLRDLYVRGKYRDVILPMTVLRRLDSLLEPSQPAVLEMKTSLDKAKIIHQDSGTASGRWPVVLQHIEVHAARPQGPFQPTTAQGRLRGVSRRLLAERPGHPREVRVSKPDSPPIQGRCPRHADREVPLAGREPESPPGPPWRRVDQAPRPG